MKQERVFTTPGDRVPRLLRHTAKEFAGAFFEDAERSPRFRAHWGGVRGYVKANWPYFIKPAHQVLVQMLTHPGTSEHLKQEIYEAVLEYQHQPTWQEFVQSVKDKEAA